MFKKGQNVLQDFCEIMHIYNAVYFLIIHVTQLHARQIMLPVNLPADNMPV